MRKVIIPLILILFSLSSCHYDKGKPIIPEDKMASFLAEYYLLQVTISQNGIPADQHRSYYYAQLLNKYGYTEAEFDSSLVWYSKNMDDLYKVYLQAESILEEQKKALTPSAEPPSQ